jgi:molybdopterin molybdotransferase
VIELEEALARILSTIPQPAIECVPLNHAHGRVVAETILSPIDLPSFDNSSMDGYALRAEDVASAKPDSPVGLQLAGRVAAGEMWDGEVTPKTCVRLFTGAPLPRGADAVVMQEDTRVEGGEPSEIQVFDAVRPWENVRLRGEDVKGGAPLARAGELLSAGGISLLAATGVTEVKAGCCPSVGLVATGSELREPGKPLAPGQIYESNRITLAGLIRYAGGLPLTFPLVPDTLADTRAALIQAFERSDLVVTSGGVSVGEMDFLKEGFEQIGGELQFWKVAVKPGRPFVFGRCRNKFLFGLPGNPVSALVTFLLLVRPALLRWQGAGEVGLPRLPGVLAEPLANPGERRHFMRVKMDGFGKVSTTGLQASHALSSVAAANGLVDVPPRTTLPSGASVQVMRWE